MRLILATIAALACFAGLARSCEYSTCSATLVIPFQPTVRLELAAVETACVVPVTVRETVIERSVVQKAVIVPAAQEVIVKRRGLFGRRVRVR